MTRRPDTAPDTRKKPADWAGRFLDTLARTGSVTRATKAVKRSRAVAYERRSTDPAFAEAWRLALQEAVDGMADEARRRAVEGVLRPVYQGGVRVGAVREHSDTLLIFLLKAHGGPAYRDANRVTVAGDPAAPVKHDHGGSVFDRIDRLAALVAGRRDVLGGGDGDGAGEPVRPGPGEGAADA